MNFPPNGPHKTKSRPKTFSNLSWIFPPNGPHKTTFGIFEILSFWLLTIFFRKVQVQHCNLSRNQKPQYPGSIFWKTSDRRAKRSEIWDLWVVVTYIGYFGLLAFKVILGSLGALTIFRNLGLVIRDRRKHFECLWELSGERKPCMASPMTLSHLTLSEAWKVKTKVPQILKHYIS